MDKIKEGPAPADSGEPTAAIPTTVKIPLPIIAPTPKIIKSKAPSVFLSPPSCACFNMESGFFIFNKFFTNVVNAPTSAFCSNSGIKSLLSFLFIYFSFCFLINGKPSFSLCSTYNLATFDARVLMRLM